RSTLPAALAQEDASTPNEARIVNRNASEERVAAEKAAQVARGHGETWTGKPEGDTNATAVKESLTHLHGGVKFDQIHNDGLAGAQGSQSMAGKATDAAKGASSKATEATKGATQHASQSAQGALNAASNKASGVAETVSSTASNAYNAAANTASQAYNTVAGTGNAASSKASEAADSASQKASRAAGATSQKASEAYQSGASTASLAAKTASDKASQAGAGTSEAGVGVLGTLQNTATSAMHTATDTATSVLSAAQQFVGMGTSGQDEAADRVGLPKESTKEAGRGIPTKRAGGDAHVVDTAPSVRN
ncbi:hypothetical protein FA13DRAFT_1724844, partial [Coprinellus micaceus]